MEGAVFESMANRLNLPVGRNLGRFLNVVRRWPVEAWERLLLESDVDQAQEIAMVRGADLVSF